MGTELEPWEAKAHRIIAAMCLKAWREANPTPAQRRSFKVGRPAIRYSVPDDARALVECLNDHDRKAAEERAKAIMLGFI